MGVRANWFTEEITGDEPAPFATIAPAEERVEDVGVPFDLRDPDLMIADLRGLIRAEARLFMEGVTCAVKDRVDTSCSACPFAHHEEEGHPLQALCQVGRNQERVVTLHAHLVPGKRSVDG